MMGVPCGGVTAALVWSGGVRVVHYGVHYVLPTAESLVHVYRARRAPCTRPPPHDATRVLVDIYSGHTVVCQLPPAAWACPRLA